MNRICCLLFATLILANPAFAQLSFITLNSSTTQNLLGVSFADTSTGYACGENGTVLKTTNGGAAWTSLTTSTTNKLWDIKAIPASGGQKVIAVGDNNTIIKSVNGGSTWTAQTIPFAAGSFVFGIQCLDSQNYFACGGDFMTTSGAVLKTTNGGATWTSVAVPGSVFLDKIFMLNGTTGFTAGTNSSFSDGSIHKTTTGTSWPSVKTSPNVITNIWCDNASNIVAVGLAGQIWKSTDGGSNWASKSFNTTDLYGVAFRDAKRGYACGGPSPVILSTADSGNTWTQESYTGSGTLQSICITGNKLFIAGDGGKILKATLPSAGVNVQQAGVAVLGINVYPNPAIDKILIANPKRLAGLSFQLTNMSGQVVAERAIFNADIEVATGSFARGFYTYTVWQAGLQITKGEVLLR